MTTERPEFSQESHDRAMEMERRGLVGCLSYILREVELAGLDLAALHLKIAIEEIRDAPLSGIRDDASPQAVIANRQGRRGNA